METTEEFRPTYMQLQANAELIPKSILVGGKIRDYISCEYCQKRRYIYSNKVLNDKEQYDYQQALESYSYSCDTPIFPNDHYLKETVFVCIQINCNSPIEILYYSSRKSENYLICYYCEEKEDLITLSQSLKERFKQIYPLCE
ncbi:17865_t:CDS:1, partial [Funneliformis caledonium]